MTSPKKEKKEKKRAKKTVKKTRATNVNNNTIKINIGAGKGGGGGGGGGTTVISSGPPAQQGWAHPYPFTPPTGLTPFAPLNPFRPDRRTMPRRGGIGGDSEEDDDDTHGGGRLTSKAGDKKPAKSDPAPSDPTSGSSFSADTDPFINGIRNRVNDLEQELNNRMRPNLEGVHQYVTDQLALEASVRDRLRQTLENHMNEVNRLRQVTDAENGRIRQGMDALGLQQANSSAAHRTMQDALDAQGVAMRSHRQDFDDHVRREADRNLTQYGLNNELIRNQNRLRAGARAQQAAQATANAGLIRRQSALEQTQAGHGRGIDDLRLGLDGHMADSLHHRNVQGATNAVHGRRIDALEGAQALHGAEIGRLGGSLGGVRQELDALQLAAAGAHNANNALVAQNHAIAQGMQGLQVQMGGLAQQHPPHAPQINVLNQNLIAGAQYHGFNPVPIVQQPASDSDDDDGNNGPLAIMPPPVARNNHPGPAHPPAIMGPPMAPLALMPPPNVAPQLAATATAPAQSSVPATLGPQLTAFGSPMSQLNFGASSSGHGGSGSGGGSGRGRGRGRGVSAGGGPASNLRPRDPSTGRVPHRRWNPVTRTPVAPPYPPLGPNPFAGPDPGPSNPSQLSGHRNAMLTSSRSRVDAQAHQRRAEHRNDPSNVRQRVRAAAAIPLPGQQPPPAGQADDEEDDL